MIYWTTQARGLVRLTRWREYVPFVIPATLAGVTLALTRSGGAPDLRVLLVLAANILVVAYAFMINDIEDAPDDARDPARARRNPVTSGEVTPLMAWASSLAVAALTVVLYLMCGPRVFLVGVFGLALAHLYSWKPVRLKAWPALDVISHALMLSALLVLAGYVTYDASPGPAWLVILGAFAGSAYGQLYNQLRDLEMDRAAGLHNTAVMTGERLTRALMYGAVAGAVACGAAALLAGLIPLWLVGAGLVILPLILLLLRPQVDMRGSAAVDASGRLQIQANVFLIVITLIWFAGVALGP